MVPAVRDQLTHSHLVTLITGMKSSVLLTVAREGLSVAMQRVFILIELFDQVVSSAEREVRNSFFLVFVAMLPRNLFLKHNTIETFMQGRDLL